MAQQFSTKPAEIATYEEIKNLSKKPEVLLIDVREHQELIDTGTVPTSINIPLGQVKEKLSNDFSDQEFLKLFNRKKPDLNNEIIFMCKIGGRSHKAMELARTLGYKNVRNYLGSWEDWSKNEGISK